MVWKKANYEEGENETATESHKSHFQTNSHLLIWSFILSQKQTKKKHTHNHRVVSQTWISTVDFVRRCHCHSFHIHFRWLVELFLALTYRTLIKIPKWHSKMKWSEFRCWGEIKCINMLSAHANHVPETLSIGHTMISILRISFFFFILQMESHHSMESYN